MCWLLVIIAFFFGISLAGAWELGLWILFMFAYPAVLLFLADVGVISYNPILFPVVAIFFLGLLYRLIEEERKNKKDFERIIKKLEELNARENQRNS